MSLAVTLVLLVAATVVFAVASILARRPAVPGEVRLIPLGAVQFVALLVMLMMAAHLVSLLTGKPLTGRNLG